MPEKIDVETEAKEGVFIADVLNEKGRRILTFNAVSPTKNPTFTFAPGMRGKYSDEQVEQILQNLRERAEMYFKFRFFHID